MATMLARLLVTLVPHTAPVPHTARQAAGVLVPQTARVPHTAPVPHTAEVPFTKTELPQTVDVPHTAEFADTVPVPQTASNAVGSRVTELVLVLNAAVGDMADPVNTSVFPRAAGMSR